MIFFEKAVKPPRDWKNPNPPRDISTDGSPLDLHPFFRPFLNPAIYSAVAASTLLAVAESSQYPGRRLFFIAAKALTTLWVASALQVADNALINTRCPALKGAKIDTKHVAIHDPDASCDLKIHYRGSAIAHAIGAVFLANFGGLAISPFAMSLAAKAWWDWRASNKLARDEWGVRAKQPSDGWARSPSV